MEALFSTLAVELSRRKVLDVKTFLYTIACWLTMQANLVVAQSLANDAKQLGMGGNDMARIERMAKEPNKATELLIAELHVVPDKKVLPNQEFQKRDTEHVLWTIRALRFVTGGKDFCAKSSEPFGKTDEEKDRRYWLRFSHGDCLTFFAMWPSHSVDYIAPADAQRAIIEQWKFWYSTAGRTHKLRPLQNPRPEQWSW